MPQNLRQQNSPERIIDALVLLSIFIFLIYYFKPDLIFSQSTTSGGDMGSDNYLAKFMRDELLPNGNMFSWSQGRWAGYPIFQFMFPFAYIIIAILGYIIPIEIAFKIVTISGIFLLPIASYLMFRWIGFKFPAPAIAAVFSVHTMFVEKHTVFGGNVPSMLAGEFSYMLSMALLVLFLGMLYKNISEKKFSFNTTGIFAAVFLSHMVTVVVAGMAAIYFLITRKFSELKSNFKILFATFGLGFLLLSFWIIPAISEIHYTSKYGRDWAADFKSWTPPEAGIIYVFAFVSIFLAIRKSDKRIFFLLFGVLVSIIGFFGGELFFTANIRFWPIIYFFAVMLAAAFFENLREMKYRDLFTLAIVVIVLVWVNSSITFIPGWIKWNYEGFEAKPAWSTYKGINDLLKPTVGRSYTDLADKNDRFGTPRAFESLPYFSGRPTLEGVYAQATITSPFISYTQCEISHHCAGIPTIAGREHTTQYNLTAGAIHLRLLNVKYLIESYEKLQQDSGNSSDWKLAGDFDEWKVYELITHDGKFVTVPSNKPNIMNVEGKDWKEISLNWWMDVAGTDTPIAFVRNGELVEKEKFSGLDISSLDEKKKISIDKKCDINEEVFSQREIKFKTSCIGEPHIISVSYFPNWKVDGAEKIYLVSPSFMLVFPNQENVRIYYDKTWDDYLGIFLTLIGALLALLYKFRKNIIITVGRNFGIKNL